MHILLVGSFHGKNKGDEAIAYAEILFLRREFPNCCVTIASQDPDYFRRAYSSLGVGAVRVTNPFTLLGALIKSQLLVVGGGGLFFEPKPGHIFHLLRNQSLVWPVLIRIAQMLRTPTLLWGVGAEPIHTRLGRHIIAWGINGSKGIIVRDKGTLDLFRVFGVTKPIVVLYDSAWLLAGRNVMTTIRPSDHNTLRVSVSPHYGISILEEPQFVEQYHRQFAEQLEQFARMSGHHQSIEYIFVPMHRTDRKECEEIRKHLSLPSTIVDVQNSLPEDIIRLLGTMDLQVGMRMHGTILATLAGVPSVSIMYANKVKETVAYIFKDGPVVPEEISLPYTSIQDLSEALYNVLQSTAAIREHLSIFCADMERHSTNVMHETFRSFCLLASTKTGKQS